MIGLNQSWNHFPFFSVIGLWMSICPVLVNENKGKSNFPSPTGSRISRREDMMPEGVASPCNCEAISTRHNGGKKPKEQKEQDSQLCHQVLPLLSSRLLDNQMLLMLKSLLLVANYKLVQSLRNVIWQYISILNVNTLWLNNSTYQNCSPQIYSHRAKISIFK